MRSSLDILEDIRKTLRDAKLVSEREQLDTEIKASATAQELCIRSGSILLTLQKKNPQVDAAIGHLIGEFIEYCHSVGLFPAEKK
jgi:hypothetical protein